MNGPCQFCKPHEKQGADRERRRIRRLIAPVLVGLRNDLQLQAAVWLDLATRAPRSKRK